MGTCFPLLAELQAALKQAVEDATVAAPLRHNAVEIFDEVNTGKNTGSGVPWVTWDLVPNRSDAEIEVYMAGGGCTLPGRAKVLMPSEGYEGVVKFVFENISTLAVNACPPVLVGVGIATSVETAAVLSRKAILRPIGTRHPNPIAADLELRLEAGLNQLGIGPQGLMGNSSVMGYISNPRLVTLLPLASPSRPVAGHTAVAHCWFTKICRLKVFPTLGRHYEKDPYHPN